MSRRVGLDPEWSDLSAEFLEDLGLGVDAPLLNEPKIFLEKPFLSALLVELEHELKPPASTRALFAIGAAHGLKAAETARDMAEEAFRAGDEDSYRWWLGICRTLDARLARQLESRVMPETALIG